MWGTLLLLVSWVFPKIASRLFLNGEPHILVSKKLWLLFVHMRIRTIWRERNRWIFDNHNENFQSIRDCFSFPSCCAKSNPLYSMYTVGSFMSYLGSFLLLPEIAAWCTHFFLFSINEVSFVDKKKKKKKQSFPSMHTAYHSNNELIRARDPLISWIIMHKSTWWDLRVLNLTYWL